MAGANYLGCDVNPQALGFARAMAERLATREWAEQEPRENEARPREEPEKGRVAFVERDAEALLAELLSDGSYPGPVVGVLAQFPTPYRLLSSRGPGKSGATGEHGASGDGGASSSEAAVGDESRGNAQLPSEAGFLLSPRLVALASKLLRQSSRSVGGVLALQSNAEDVAACMDATVRAHAPSAARVPHRAPPTAHRVPNRGDQEDRESGSGAAAAAAAAVAVPQRQQRWRAGLRASGQAVPSTVDGDVGEKWDPAPLWPLAGQSSGGDAEAPRRARSETEAAYEHDRKPIYRLLYRFQGKAE
jgi:hypothetical protein